MKDEALKKAEHALEGVLQVPEKISMMHILDVVRFIRQAREEKQQEPVLMFYEQEWQGKTSRAYQWLIDPFSLPAGTKLYTSPPAQPQQEPVAGCVCRWNSEGDRVVTCERHQGWLEVIAEWADRAREAEKKLKFLMNTSPPAQPQPEPVAWIPIITWRWNNNAETWEGLTNTSPPARKPLTDEEIESMWIGSVGFLNPMLNQHTRLAFARAIEAKHNIKE